MNKIVFKNHVIKAVYPPGRIQPVGMPVLQFVCELPPEYHDKPVSLCPYKDNLVIAITEDEPPLLINTDTGEIRKLEVGEPYERKGNKDSQE